MLVNRGSVDGVRVRRVARFALAGLFIVAGANHFLIPDFYIGIMPPYLPAHLELVYLSGILEILGGGAVLVERLRTRAGFMLILLLIAVFPANLHMAMNPDLFSGFHRGALYLRLPVQGLMIVWAYWATRPDSLMPPVAEAAGPQTLDGDR